MALERTTLLAGAVAFLGVLGASAALGDEGAKSAPPAAPSPAPAAEAPSPSSALGAEGELRGMRCRLVLRGRAVIEGVLPEGKAWEKRDEKGQFVPAQEKEPGAGLRLFFAMGMDGEIFIRTSDIKDVVDLGNVSDEIAAALKEKILAERRRLLEEKEELVRKELARILGSEQAPAPAPASTAPLASAETPAATAAPAAAPPVASAETPAAAKISPEEARRRKGDALLDKFPSPDWSEKRYLELYDRIRLAKVAPDTQEQEFLDGFELWKEALGRRKKAEEAAAAAQAPAPAR